MASVPLPTTPSDIIELALKATNVLGVGQVAAAEDMTDAFNILNMMMAQWQRQRLNVYHLVNTAVTATGAVSYTVGPGQDFDIPRPAAIESAFFRQQAGTPQPVDYPLNIIRAREDYNRIAVKHLNAFPQFAFYDSAYPVGNLFIWPIPNNQYEIHISTLVELQRFQSMDDVIQLPDEYKDALFWNLARRLCPMYGQPISQDLKDMARQSLSVIESTNAQFASLRMPGAVRPRSGTYNIYGDYMIGSSR